MGYQEARKALDDAAVEINSLMPFNWDTRAEKARLLMELARYEVGITVKPNDVVRVVKPGQLW